MNILQRESHKHFSNQVAKVDPLLEAPFTVTTLDPVNVELIYSWVDSKVVAELIKNILTDAEYSKLM